MQDRFCASLCKALAAGPVVVDLGYDFALPVALPLATHVVFLDLPLTSIFPRLVWRSLRQVLPLFPGKLQ
jgi:hypothetical protein